MVFRACTEGFADVRWDKRFPGPPWGRPGPQSPGRSVGRLPGKGAFSVESGDDGRRPLPPRTLAPPHSNLSASLTPKTSNLYVKQTLFFFFHHKTLGAQIRPSITLHLPRPWSRSLGPELLGSLRKTAPNVGRWAFSRRVGCRRGAQDVAVSSRRQIVGAVAEFHRKL